jgi:hypothetical protein
MHAGGRRGVSKVAVPAALIVIVVIVVAGAYFALNKSPATSTTTSSSGPPPTSLVSTDVNQLVQDLNARNVDGLVSLYSPNSVLVWSGNVGGLAGMYTGGQNIRLIYATTVGKSSSLDANLSNYDQTVVSPTVVNATFQMKLLANSTAAGIVHATIDVTEEWTGVSGSWQISKENWAYTLYDSSFIDAGIPSATTFPQWGYELKGGNPNLVSEKSFEWHAGPYIAASVYAFLFGVLALAALRLRSIGKARGTEANRPLNGP